jgi:hypothetical protein
MLRRATLALCAAAVLGGCESYGNLTSDAFDPGNASQSRFTFDAGQCAAQAQISRDYGLHGITGTHTDRHEIYNHALAACMQGAGYARRDWSPAVPSPYSVDPTPF